MITKTAKKITTIQYGQPIEFNWESDLYGRAEFIVCPVFVRGIMRKLYIDPKQQPKYDMEMFEVDLQGAKIRTLSLTGYPGLDADPRVWTSFWCKDHKCYSLELYVADNIRTLSVAPHFGDSVTLEFHR